MMERLLDDSSSHFLPLPLVALAQSSHSQTIPRIDQYFIAFRALYVSWTGRQLSRSSGQAFTPYIRCDAKTITHLTPIHSIAQANPNTTSMTTIMRPRISSASPISSLATFLIFLCRCHDFLFFRFFGFSSSCSSDRGPIASWGSTCPVVPLLPHFESSGSW